MSPMIRHAVSILLVLALACLAGCAKPGGEGAAVARPIIIDAPPRPWDTPRTKGVQFISDHYHIYTTVDRQPLRKYLPGFMEAAHEHYLEMTGLAGRPRGRRMVMYVMATRRQWVLLTIARLGPRADGPLNITAGGYCYAGVCVLWDIGIRSTLSVASHEGLHQFFAHRMSDSLPMWLEEGLCAMAEAHIRRRDTVVFTPEHNPSRITCLRTAIINNHWIPIERLLPMDAGDAVGKSSEKSLGYYGQVWALSLFLRSVPAYRQGMERLIKDAQAGRLHRAAGVSARALAQLRRLGRPYNRTVSLPLFRHYITGDIAAFDRAYLAFARNLSGLK